MIDPVYDDGAVTLYHGDSRDLLPLVEARHGRVQHTLTDAPYSPRTHANAKTLRGGEGAKTLIDFASADFMSIREILALANPERWTINFTDHVYAAMFELMPPDGMRHMRTAAWVKPDGTPQLTGDRPAQAHESIAILHPPSAAEWNSGGKRGVWTHGVERDIPWHSTPKPVPLLMELIDDFTKEGELVMDPYAGSGAVGVAARNRKRRAVLIEKDEEGEFIHLTIQRLREGRARPVSSEPVQHKNKNQMGFGF